MLTPDEMRAKIVDKAAEDADFRALLLSDPKSAVEQELGSTSLRGSTSKCTKRAAAPRISCFPRQAVWAKS